MIFTQKGLTLKIMKNSVRAFIFLLILAAGLGGPPLFAMDAGAFLNGVAFETTLSQLCDLVRTGTEEDLRELIREDRIYLLVGTIYSRINQTGTGEVFSGELEIMDGEWLGVEDVQVFWAAVKFTGQRFDGMIPLRRSRNVNPREVTLNSRVLLAAKLTGYRDHSGMRIPVMEGIEIRTIE